jgi:hypothetical protein
LDCVTRLVKCKTVLVSTLAPAIRHVSSSHLTTSSSHIHIFHPTSPARRKFVPPKCRETIPLRAAGRTRPFPIGRGVADLNIHLARRWRQTSHERHEDLPLLGSPNVSIRRLTSYESVFVGNQPRSTRSSLLPRCKTSPPVCRGESCGSCTRTGVGRWPYDSFVRRRVWESCDKQTIRSLRASAAKMYYSACKS